MSENPAFQNFTPKTNPAKEQATIAESDAINDATLTKLDTMTPDELKALVRLCNADRIGIALMTAEEMKAATRLRLSEIALRNKDDKVALQAIQQLLDRLEGKPIGTAPSINIGGNGGAMTVEVVLVNAGEYKAKMIEG